MQRLKNKLTLLLILLTLLISACSNAPAVANEVAEGNLASSPTTTATSVPTSTQTPQLQFNSPVSPVSRPDSASNSASEVSYYTYNIINTYPHDRSAFTQGLLPMDGIFYEGTGLYGRSTLRKVEPESGEILQQVNLPAAYFGEGIAIFGDKLYQLTWKSNTGFVYDKDSFELLQKFYYPTEGWGITHDDQKLIMSDGTDTLYFWNPETLAEIGRVRVYDDNGPVVRLNELEYINGEVYANVWQTNRIARINPETGQVTGWIDLSGLLAAEDLSQPVDVLNGIAYNAEEDRLFVTGKLWPKLFEIELEQIAPE